MNETNKASGHFPCEKVIQRMEYEVDSSPVVKTVKDYAEEICAVLDDPIMTAEGLGRFVNGACAEEGEAHEKPTDLLDMLQLTLNKAKYLREQLWHLQKLMQ